MTTANPFNAESAEDTQKSQKESRGENDFSREIIGAAVEVQRVLGTGLLESAYTAALKIELAQRGLSFAYEVPIDGSYKGRPMGVRLVIEPKLERALVAEGSADLLDAAICAVQAAWAATSADYGIPAHAPAEEGWIVSS